MGPGGPSVVFAQQHTVLFAKYAEYDDDDII
jgi:hypothetical protein